MIKIDLDGIENYKTIASSTREYLTTAIKSLIDAAQTMKNVDIDSDSLSHNNPAYTAAAMEVKRKSIVSDINSKVYEIDNIKESLNNIDKMCDSYIEDVESDDVELLKILGVYGEDGYASLNIEDYVITGDILTFDPANCDFYINKEKTKIYFQIPYDKQSEEKYKIRDIKGGSCVKYLFTCYSADEGDKVNEYSVIMCKIGKDYRIGYVYSGDLTPLETDEQGKMTSHSNLDDIIEEGSGYGVIKSTHDVTVKPFPDSDQGEKTEAIHSSRETYVTSIPYGTPVKIIGTWRNEEQDLRSSYLVAFSTESGNFMGYVDGKDLQIGKNGTDYTMGSQVFPVVTNTSAELICDNGVKKTVPAGTTFKYEGEIEDFYHGTYVENGEICNAWVPKDNSSREVPSSFAKMDDLY